jgi:hypothetical protein
MRLCPFGTSATVWSIVPATDDRWWVWGSRWNENLKEKPKYLEKTYPSATLSTTNPTWPDLVSNPGRCCGKPATNRLSYGTVGLKLFWIDPGPHITETMIKCRLMWLVANCRSTERWLWSIRDMICKGNQSTLKKSCSFVYRKFLMDYPGTELGSLRSRWLIAWRICVAATFKIWNSSEFGAWGIILPALSDSKREAEAGRGHIAPRRHLMVILLTYKHCIKTSRLA